MFDVPSKNRNQPSKRHLKKDIVNILINHLSPDLCFKSQKVALTYFDK